MGGRVAVAFALVVGLAALAQGEPVLEPAPPELDGRSIAALAEATLRSDHTYLDAEMTVISPRLTAPRVVAFQSWDDRPGRRSFIRIASPAKDSGTTFLKLHPNLFRMMPGRFVKMGYRKVGVTYSIPAAAFAVLPAIALAMVPVRRIRRRRRGLCVQCGYDLTGNESGVCSECGENV